VKHAASRHASVDFEQSIKQANKQTNKQLKPCRATSDPIGLSFRRPGSRPTIAD
jgi:hypothetical protein